MTLFERIFPPFEEVMDLPAEEVAFFVLKYLKEDDSRSPNFFNFTNYSNRYFQEYVPNEHRREFVELIASAWNWLENQGFLAPDPEQSSGDWYFVTSKGRQIDTAEDFDSYQKGTLLPREMLLPELERKVRPLFLQGDYDTAVFKAFRILEVSIREAGEFTDKDIGRSLARKAFDSDDGPLRNEELERGERDAEAHLMAGALGVFKNPASHREVEMEPVEAAEAIHLANHLIRIVNNRAEVESD